MKRVENLSKIELKVIKDLIGEAFVTNELFHEFGDINSRKSLVMKYMSAYVECVYKSGSLYQNDDGTAFIGLEYSGNKSKLAPKLKMLFTMLLEIPMPVIKRFMAFADEIKNSNEKYTSSPYVEILMVCVKKEYQGKGLTKELVNFAKEMAKKYKAPILFDTDMEKYAQMYQHYGCELYNTTTASNGVTRYNLVWKNK